VTSAFIEAKQLQLALKRIPQQTEITLTLLTKCRAIACYNDNPKASSGVEALGVFVSSLSSLLTQVDAKLIFHSKHCLNISGDEHTMWDYQVVIAFSSISSITELLSLEAFHDILPHFYAGASKYDTVISY